MIAKQIYSILLVDDERCIRESMAMVLASVGYVVSTALHGVDALLQLEHATPDAIISDLNMPEMSGFEFLSIARLRYPTIPLIAMSGIFGSGGGAPEGVIADDFYAKGQDRPDKLLRSVDELIRAAATRAADKKLGPSSVTEPPLVCQAIA